MSDRGPPRRREAPPGPPLVSVVGWKDSGKTGLVVRLAAALSERGHRVMTLKHGHGFDLDAEGTDSWRHRHEGGAERVVLSGPDGLALFGGWGPDGELGPRALAARFCPDADVVLAEGWKGAPVPKIEVHRSGAGDGLIFDPGSEDAGFWVAVVSDRDDLALALPVLPLDDARTAERLADMVEATLVSGAGSSGGGE